MKKVCSSLIAMTMLLSVQFAFAEGSHHESSSESPLVYYELSGHSYYHIIDDCAIASEYSIPMQAIEKEKVRETFPLLRPCMLCTPAENDLYYEQATAFLSEGEIDAYKDYDRIELALLHRDSFTFEDWAELFPGTYTVPAAHDIPAEKAIALAREVLVNAYAVSPIEASEYEESILCIPNMGPGEKAVENGYVVQFSHKESPLLFTIRVMAETGEIVQVDRSGAAN